MILANAKIVDENFTVRKCDLRLEQEKIAEIGVGLTGGEILEESNNQFSGGVGSDVTQNVQAGESRNGNAVGCPVGFFVKIAENQSPVKALFHRRHQNHCADKHQKIISPA